MIKEYFEARKIKQQIKQHLKGYEYACGCLISKSKTEEELRAETDRARDFCDYGDFDYGIEDAIEDLHFYCNYKNLTK